MEFELTEQEKEEMADSNGIFYMVVYPCGDRSKLSVPTVQWFDVDDYDLASEKRFYSKKEAIAYAKYLSNKYNKIFDTDDTESGILE